MTRAMKALVGILVWREIARGVDYVTGSTYDMGRVWGDRLTMPEMWGAACLIVAALAVVGLALDRPRWVANIAIGGMAVSVMFAVQIADVRMFTWPPEDIRIITDHLANAATWLLVAVTTHYRLGVDKRKTEILEEADG